MGCQTYAPQANLHVKRGATNGMAKLSEADAQFILDSGEPTIVLCRRFGVCSYTVRSIRARTKWLHLTPTVGSPGYQRYEVLVPAGSEAAVTSVRERDLEAEVERLTERLRWFEDEVCGGAWSFPNEWVLTLGEQRLLSALVSSPRLTIEAAMVVLYGLDVDHRDRRIISLMIYTIRRKLRPFGFTITTNRGMEREQAVYSIAEGQRAEIRRRMEVFKPPWRQPRSQATL